MSAAHTTTRKCYVFVSCLLLVSGNVVFAEPYLQLDANPAIYLSAPEESIVTTDLQFTLYALVSSGKGPTSGFFYLSAAVVPKLYTAADLGSFVLDGTTISVVGDMQFGTPPIDTDRNPDEVAKHGIFETYYYEHKFTLNLNNKADVYDSQFTQGGPTPNPAGTLYYEDFIVDASGLASGYKIHFDFYTKNLDGTLDKFAPFSHDLLAAPIPASVILGMLGLGVVGLKLRKFA